MPNARDASPKAKSVRIGDTEINEVTLQARLQQLRLAIETWAKRRQLWMDTNFHVPFVYRRERPRPAEVLLIISEGPLGRILGTGMSEKYEKEFCALLERHGFWYSMENHYTVCLYPEDHTLQTAYLVFNRWRWVQDLARNRLFEIHTEVFEHFAARPDDLKRLSWRQYEELLDAVFKNQGFITKLGPGGNDGGVDLRLYQSASVPELVAIIQAKRYLRKPIGIETVAALLGISAKECAPQGILATTSRFLPSAQKFALSTESRIDLPTIKTVDSHGVAGWCREIASHLQRFFATGADAPPFAVSIAPSELVGKIVVASGGYNMTINDFAVIEADFAHEVILRPIGAEAISGDRQTGTESPKEGAKATWTTAARLTAFKAQSTHSGKRYFRGDRRLFSLWNGKPMSFNYCD